MVTILIPNQDPIVLDCADGIEPNLTADVAEHPVEVGANIVDHVRPLPVVLTIKGWISNTPVGPEAEARVERATGTVGLIPGGTTGYAETLLNRLIDLRDNPQLVSVTTSRRSYENMVLASLSAPQDATTGDSVMLSMEFHQVRLVKTKTTQVDAKYLRAKKKTNLGTKQATEPTAAEEGKGRTILDDSLHGIGVDLGRLSE